MIMIKKKKNRYDLETRGNITVRCSIKHRCLLYSEIADLEAVDIHNVEIG